MQNTRDRERIEEEKHVSFNIFADLSFSQKIAKFINFVFRKMTYDSLISIRFSIFSLGIMHSPSINRLITRIKHAPVIKHYRLIKAARRRGQDSVFIRARAEKPARSLGKPAIIRVVTAGPRPILKLRDWQLESSVRSG